jgi:D-aminoacyl-tRNA deacylase
VRAVVQRVSEAAVSVGGESVSAIGAGVVVLLGVASGDTAEGAERMAGKGGAPSDLRERRGTARPRARRHRRRGARRQSVHARRGQQAPEGNSSRLLEGSAPEVAEPLYARFCEALRAEGVPVQTGVFGARMVVSIVNDGPVTIVLDV